MDTMERGGLIRARHLLEHQLSALLVDIARALLLRKNWSMPKMVKYVTVVAQAGAKETSSVLVTQSVQRATFANLGPSCDGLPTLMRYASLGPRLSVGLAKIFRNQNVLQINTQPMFTALQDQRHLKWPLMVTILLVLPMHLEAF